MRTFRSLPSRFRQQSSNAALRHYNSPSNPSRTIVFPKRIIICRHGESKGNVSDSAYVTTPDWLIPLSPKGVLQSTALAHNIKRIVGDESLYFYTSPYLRTKQTTNEMLNLMKPQTLGVREEPRLTEQQFGNFQNVVDVREQKSERIKYGRFYYRFPLGESGLDVYNRASSFINTLYRDFEDEDIVKDENTNIVIVCHGLTMRLLLLRFFHFTVTDFERSENIDNAKYVIMERLEQKKIKRKKRGVFQLNENSLKLLKFPPNKLDEDQEAQVSQKGVNELMKEMRRAGLSSLSDPAEHIKYWTKKPFGL